MIVYNIGTVAFLADIRRRQVAALYNVHARPVSQVVADVVTLEEARFQCHVDTFEEGSPPATFSDFDEWFVNIGIPAAREFCEVELGLALATRTMEVTATSFPTNAASATYGPAIPLPFGPVQSIVSITYIDQAAADAAYTAAYDAAYAPAYITAYDDEFLLTADPILAEAAGIAAGVAAGVAAGDAAYAIAIVPVTMPDTDYLLDITSNPHQIVLAYGATWPSIIAQPGAVEIRYDVGYSAPDDSPQIHVLPATAKMAVLLVLKHLQAHVGDESIDIPPAAYSYLWRVPGRQAVNFA